MMLDLLLEMDSLLGTNEDFLLGRWLKDARAWGKNQQVNKKGREI